MASATPSGARRVVITGMGAVSPFGIGKDALWEGLVAGTSRTSDLSEVTASDLFGDFVFRSRVIAEVERFDPDEAGVPAEVKKLDRFIQFGVAAGLEAARDARLEPGSVDNDRLGVTISTAICGTPQLERVYLRITDEHGNLTRPENVTTDFYLAAMSNTPGIILSSILGARGPCATVSTGCVGGLDAVGYAFEAVRDGDVDVMLTGASEAPICPITVAAFDVIRCLSSRHNDRPEKASRPFDADRDGFVLGEGCAMLVLEELQHALARGARVYAEVTGFSLVSNAIHMTDLLSDGADLARAMDVAMAEGGVGPQDIDHVNAHGSSTPQNDSCETSAIKMALGEHAYAVPINSIKSMIGHPLSAAGALEIVACALALQHDYVPPTINYETPDPECDLDYVPNQARKQDVDVALSNAFGFGGTNATLVFQKYRR
jgi:beta-ketoacyl-acyl-carrier-protein synthase II